MRTWSSRRRAIEAGDAGVVELLGLFSAVEGGAAGARKGADQASA
jgi:hypothetical protein